MSWLVSVAKFTRDFNDRELGIVLRKVITSELIVKLNEGDDGRSTGHEFGVKSS